MDTRSGNVYPHARHTDPRSRNARSMCSERVSKFWERVFMFSERVFMFLGTCFHVLGTCFHVLGTRGELRSDNYPISDRFLSEIYPIFDDRISDNCRVRG